MKEKDKKVFISYSKKDEDIVKVLENLIYITGNIPDRDERFLEPGDDWAKIINEHINNCSTFLVFWCRHSGDSFYVNYEISIAEQYSKRIVTVKLDDYTLPEKLSQYHYIDLKSIMWYSHNLGKYGKTFTKIGTYFLIIEVIRFLVKYIFS